MASGTDFPFTIMDVAFLLRLNIRRRSGGRVAYADCPICGDRRGKLALYPEIDTWRCYHCGEGGGMLALYGKTHGIGNSEAYREICGALKVGAPGRECTPKVKAEQAPDVPQSQRASPQEIHRTLTTLLRVLPLRPAHREHLRTKRGLSDEQIRQFGFKSTPRSCECRAIAHRLAESGCTLEGVPGFYLDEKGRWTMKFFDRTSGIVIPLRGADGLLQGLQIRLDHPIKKEGDPPEKSGIKYLPFTSTGKPMGVTSGNPIHFVGDPSSRVVYVTEGALKADIAHALTGRTFAATVGVNNTKGLDELFAFLRRNGTEEIVEAEDMDKYCDPNVSRGASKVHALALKNGLRCRRLVWNPNHKGIDDWLLALRRKETTEKEREQMNFKEMYLNGMCPFGYIDGCMDQWRNRPDLKMSAAVYLGLDHEEHEMFLHEPAALKERLDGQRSVQKFRVYQLDIKGIETHSFAFRGIEFLCKAGYQHPPADSYRLVYDGELIHPRGLTEEAVLARIYEHCNDYLPEGYQGHSLSMSDVVELYDEDDRDFFYCDEDGFTPVRFDAEQAAPMAEADGDE